MEIKSWHLEILGPHCNKLSQARMVENLDLAKLFSYVLLKFHYNTAKVIMVWIMILQKKKIIMSS